VPIVQPLILLQVEIISSDFWPDG